MSEDACRLVTLTTDFGHKDPYVGIVKGVILSFCPQAKIVDLNHEIPPFDILAGAFSLKISLPYFAPGSLHIAVVDPKVGTRQRRIALEMRDSIILAPDNGLTTAFIPLAQRAFELDKPEFFLASISSTFHARDIFAPVSAHLLNGVPLEKLGAEIDKSTLSTIAGLEPSIGKDRIEGAIVYSDRYGNLITNLSTHCREKIKEISIGSRVLTIAPGSYDTIGDGEAQIVSGSHGYLEIAMKEASALAYLNVRNGQKVTVKTK